MKSTQTFTTMDITWTYYTYDSTERNRAATSSEPLSLINKIALASTISTEYKTIPSLCWVNVLFDEFNKVWLLLRRIEFESVSNHEYYQIWWTICFTTTFKAFFCHLAALFGISKLFILLWKWYWNTLRCQLELILK